MSKTELSLFSFEICSFPIIKVVNTSILSSCYMPGLILSILYLLFIWSSQQSWEVIIINIVPTLLMKELRNREIRSPATVIQQWRSWDLNSDYVAPEAMLLVTVLLIIPAVTQSPTLCLRGLASSPLPLTSKRSCFHQIHPFPLRYSIPFLQIYSEFLNNFPSQREQSHFFRWYDPALLLQLHSFPFPTWNRMF